MAERDELVVLADIGGTNTRVALARGTELIADSIRKFPNKAYCARGQDIAQILADYLAAAAADVAGVCVAAAGPVQDGVAQMTNLEWVIDADKLTAATGARDCAILNDLQAQGHALGHVPEENLNPVITGPKEPGAMLVVGLGTGVNAAPVHGHGAARVVPPSECGHVNMPVRGAEGARLQHFIEALLAARGETPHAGAEEVLSGRGLGNLGLFAAAEAGQAWEVAEDRAASDTLLAALSAGDGVAEHAARTYTAILAQFLADLALVHLPYGGIYLIGGMARAMSPHFSRFGLSQAFREPRRVNLLTEDFSVTVVEDDYAALTGCAHHLAHVRGQA